MGRTTAWDETSLFAIWDELSLFVIWDGLSPNPSQALGQSILNSIHCKTIQKKTLNNSSSLGVRTKYQGPKNREQNTKGQNTTGTNTRKRTPFKNYVFVMNKAEFGIKAIFFIVGKILEHEITLSKTN